MAGLARLPVVPGSIARQSPQANCGPHHGIGGTSFTGPHHVARFLTRDPRWPGSRTKFHVTIWPGSAKFLFSTWFRASLRLDFDENRLPADVYPERFRCVRAAD